MFFSLAFGDLLIQPKAFTFLLQETREKGDKKMPPNHLLSLQTLPFFSESIRKGTQYTSSCEMVLCEKEQKGHFTRKALVAKQILSVIHLAISSKCSLSWVTESSELAAVLSISVISRDLSMCALPSSSAPAPDLLTALYWVKESPFIQSCWHGALSKAQIMDILNRGRGGKKGNRKMGVEDCKSKHKWAKLKISQESPTCGTFKSKMLSCHSIFSVRTSFTNYNCCLLLVGKPFKVPYGSP